VRFEGAQRNDQHARGARGALGTHPHLLRPSFNERSLADHRPHARPAGLAHRVNGLINPLARSLSTKGDVLRQDALSACNAAV